MASPNQAATRRRGLGLFRRDKEAPEPPRGQSPASSPEDQASFWSRLVFAWLSPLLKVGFRRPLERDDIWLVPSSRRADSLQHKLRESFENLVLQQQQRQQQQNGRDRIIPLARALYESFKVDFWVGGLCQLTESVLQAMAPFTLRFLIVYAREANAYARGDQDAQPPSAGRGMGIVLAITAMQVAQSFSSGHFHYRSSLLAGQARAALIATAFSKSLRLSRRARAGGEPEPGSEPEPEPLETGRSPETPSGTSRRLDWRSSPAGWSNGRVMNLISTDVSRIEQSCTTFHLVWTSPIAILLTVALLLANLGYPSLAGVAVLVLGLTGLTRVVKVYSGLRAAINDVTDERAGLTQEVLHGIRFVKYFGWEAAFLERLRAIRASETRSLQMLHITKSAIGAVSMALPIFSSMAAFLVYAAVNPGPLDPALIFSSLALFNSLRTPMNWLPTSVGHLVDAISALKRVETFLLAEEAPRRPSPTPGLLHAIELDDATFTWEASPPTEDTKNANDEKTAAESPSRRTTAPFRLENVSLAVAPGELVAVVGAVGCGKSSLLSALASDMRRVSGNMRFDSETAYCPQSAWLQNASVRDNIVFGKPFDEPLYARVVRACALVPDFDSLPDGDLTEIGEKGITLSGGQKQRVNIARAIYSDAGIVLLDDPLSAVDAHVGSHIFDHAICGLLRDRSRVLVTHQLHVLPHCDRVVWMVDGRVEGLGPYQELVDEKPEFARFVAAAGTLGPAKGGRDTSDTQQDDEPRGDEEEDSGGGGDDEAPRRQRPNLMQEDVKAVNSVPWSVYLAWMRSSGSLFNVAAVIALLCAFRAANILTSLSLAWWVADLYGLERAAYIGLYAGLGVAQGLVLFVFSMTTCIVGTRASQAMSNDAMWQILRAPMSFFDTTPLGRITHRFTKDVDTMDNNLTDSFRQYLIVLSSLLGTFGLIISYFHYFAVALAVTSAVLVIAVSYYRRSARELKRHHAVLDGAVFARFSEALVGASTIRAYGREDQYVREIHRAVDDMDGACFLTFASQRWLSLRLDNLGILLSLTTGILVVTTAFDVPSSITGLILSYSLSLVGIIQITVRYLADVDNSMSSTERLYQYTSTLEREASLDDDDDDDGDEGRNQTRSAWPEKGEIRFESVQMRYRPDLPLVLDNFSLAIKGGERIGIVGRTGAGKSTILSTLFRLTKLSGGKIVIDGVDVAKVGLHRLRSRLAIIPQDPTLFRGTVRSNLDPFDKHTDLELWDALRQAHLVPGKAPPGSSGESDSAEDDIAGADGARGTTRRGGEGVVLSSRDTGADDKEARIALDGPVEEEGLNFSLGQRQLLALARALLRNARVTLIDEGTSSVDSATDARIQETIASEFRGGGKTLIAIAHRLRTVLLYDRVCVMDEGRIAELGPPAELWERGGIFRGMCDRSGITRDDFTDSASGSA